MIVLVLLVFVGESWASQDDEKRIRLCVGRDAFTGAKQVIGCWPADRCYCGSKIFEPPRCDCEPWPTVNTVSTSSPYTNSLISAGPQKKMQGWDPVHVLGIGGAIIVVITLTSIACCCGCRQWIKPRVSNVRSIHVEPKPPPYSLSPPPPYNGTSNRVQILNIQTNTTRTSHTPATSSRDQSSSSRDQSGSRDQPMTSRVYTNSSAVDAGSNLYPHTIQRQMDCAARDMNISSGSSISAIHVDPNERPLTITLARGRPSNIVLATQSGQRPSNRASRSEGTTHLYLEEL